VAYASSLAVDNHRQVQSWGVVLPSHRGRGLGSLLIDLVEARAGVHVGLAHAEGPVVLRFGVIGTDEAAHRLIVARGFAPVRHFWRMHRSLANDLAAPWEIPGIRLRPFRYGEDDRAFHAAVEESFADHWGFVQRGFDEWAEHRFNESAFNPDLWFVAEEGGEVAGCLMGVDENGKAWVGMLGVRQVWRRRGIGEALLRHAFVEFRRRGYDEVGLTVDAANQTGATALYDRVGMRAIRRYDVYEKQLR
jgi:mycothiol synthase